MRMGDFSWLHPAADAAGDPHSRSPCRAKPVYSGLICWRCWATAEHRVAQSQPSGLRWLLISWQPNSSAKRTRPEGSHSSAGTFSGSKLLCPAVVMTGDRVGQRRAGCFDIAPNAGNIACRRKFDVGNYGERAMMAATPNRAFSGHCRGFLGEFSRYDGGSGC